MDSVCCFAHFKDRTFFVHLIDQLAHCFVGDIKFVFVHGKFSKFHVSRLAWELFGILLE